MFLAFFTVVCGLLLSLKSENIFQRSTLLVEEIAFDNHYRTIPFEFVLTILVSIFHLLRDEREKGGRLLIQTVAH